MEIEDRYVWMSADGRVNYLKLKEGWTVGPRSIHKDGRQADRDRLTAAGLIKDSGKHKRVWRTRAEAVDAIVDLFAATADPLAPGVRKRPVALPIAGLWPYGVLRHADGWGLARTKQTTYRNPLVNAALAERGIEQWTASWTVEIRRIHAEWETVSELRFATRAAAVEELRAWLASHGIDAPTMTASVPA